MNRRTATALALSAMCAAALATAPASSAESAPQAAPKLTVERLDAGGFRVSWTKVAGATGYEVWREMVAGGSIGSVGYVRPPKGRGQIASVSASVTSFTTDDFYEPEANDGPRSLTFSVRPTAKGKSFAAGSGRAGCAAGYFLSARGSGQNPTDGKENGYARGMGREGDRVYRDVADRLDLSHSTFQPNPVLYPAVPPSRFRDYPDSVGKAVDDVTRQVASITQTCPSARVALFGFSQGAHAVGNGFADLPAASRDRVLHLLLFADPARNPDDPAVRPMPGPSTGAGLAGARPAFTRAEKGQVSSWCWSKDVVCRNTDGNRRIHGSPYDCYERWAARAVAEQARAMGWRPSASLARPSCSMAS